MKIGVMICSYYLRPDGTLPEQASKPPLDETPKLTADAGLGALELQDPGGGFEETFPDAPSLRRLKQLKETAGSSGVEIPAISAMGGNLLSPDTERQLSYLQKWLTLASSLEIRTLKINVGAKPPGLSDSRSFERARAALVRCAKLAGEYGIVLAPELWPPSYPTSDVHAMITLMRLIDSKQFRHTLDNYQLPAGWPVTAYRLLAPFATHVHVSTRGIMDGPQDQRFRFASFVSILRAIGYDGYLMIEARPHDPSMAARLKQLSKTKNTLLRLISS